MTDTEIRESARFRYSGFTYVSVLVTLVASGLMVSNWLWPPITMAPLSVIGAFSMIGAIWFSSALFLASPLILVVDANCVSATYLWGSRRSWPRAGLQVKQRAALSSRLSGATEVVNIQGQLVFRVWPGLVGPRTFSEQLASEAHAQGTPLR